MKAAQSQLWIVGTPLSESTPLSDDVIDLLKRCEIVIGESAKVARRWCFKHDGLKEKSWFFLDGLKPHEEKDLNRALAACKKNGGHAALFSDGGMPILFDPGSNVLTMARELGFSIRTLAGPTSWGTALAVCGWEPPFLIEGFAPRKTEDRQAYFAQLSKRHECIVILDTPYRFELTLSQLQKAFPPDRPLFIAWEIATENERFFWTTIGKATSTAAREQLKKGEFVLILGAH